MVPGVWVGRSDGAEAGNLAVADLPEDLGLPDVGLLVVEHEGHRHGGRG